MPLCFSQFIHSIPVVEEVLVGLLEEGRTSSL